jgi:hypothetical protein
MVNSRGSNFLIESERDTIIREAQNLETHVEGIPKKICEKNRFPFDVWL